MDSEPGAAVTERMKDEGLSQLRVIFLDYNGIARARSVSLQNVPSVFTRGVNFSSPTVDFNSRDLFPPSAAFTLASPDVYARGDAETYSPVPYAPGSGQVHADLIDARGEPWAGCPRTVLRRALERSPNRDFRFNVGFEPEAYLFEPGDGSPSLVGVPQFATLAGLDIHAEFVDSLLESLAALGLEVEQWSEEYGPGQIEVNLRYSDALTAADGLVTFKETFRAIARRHGLIGTFMPKPFGDQAGTGLHVHLSASSVEGVANLFDDPADELGLSPLGRHALGGLLAHGEALTALGATTVNSYKRFLPGSWAPTHIVASYASRAAFVRVPERETARRLELRVGDGAGNPYIYLTGIIAAMLDGIERELEPEPIVAGDVGALTPAEANAIGARPVPRTLGDALNALERDETICRALGSIIAQEFIKVKRSEWGAFALHVGPWDREWYLGRY